MKQLITRIDDDLHERLKARAAAEGVSVNSLVTDLLRGAVVKLSDRDAARLRARAAGLEVVRPRPARRPPSRDAVIASTRGAGRIASEALEADRSAR